MMQLTELEHLLPKTDLPYEQLFEGARYSLLAPGKRFRPRLVLATVEALGGSPETAVQPACAIECVHAYSLIHDDLPCMDDSDERRGKPSLHRVIGEGQAILVGDFLLTYAFELLATAPDLSAETRIRLTEVLAKRSGGHGMVGGQVMDLAFEDQAIDFETLRTLDIKKTGALITAALEFGGILCNYPLEPLQTIGEAIGLAFQIVDDLDDQDEGKPTYISLLGTEGAEEQADQLLQIAFDTVATLPGDLESLQALIRGV